MATHSKYVQHAVSDHSTWYVHIGICCRSYMFLTPLGNNDDCCEVSEQLDHERSENEGDFENTTAQVN